MIAGVAEHRSSNPFDLSGQTAVVTGAASGLGRASAVVLAAAGAQVVCADVSPALEETVAAIKEAGGLAAGLATDVSRREQVDALVAWAVAETGRLDIMCNVAGVMTNSLVLDLTDEDLDRVFSVNLKGVLYGCQAAGRRMIVQGGGAIINFSSQIIGVAAPNTVNYGMTKAAIVQLTKTLAKEIGPSGVRVNAVAPGFVETKLTARHFTLPDGTIERARREEVVAKFTSSRVLPDQETPEDVASVVLFLASSASRSMTGQVLWPNGGSWM